MLIQPFLAALSTALNAYLHLDTETEAHLQSLADKVITLELKPFACIFQCRFTATGVTLHAGEILPADARISGTPLQLVGVVLTKKNRQGFFADDVHLSGDAAFAADVMALFDHIEIDWENYLARVIGDVPAHHTGRFVTHCKTWLQTTHEHLRQTVSEYLHEEVQWFPAREALNDFFNEIDTLRMDVDRLEMQLQQLRSRLANHKESS